MPARIDLEPDKIASFCRKWRIQEFSLFGSVVREDFNDDSDVDVLVRFDPEAPWDLLHIAEMKLQLQEMFGREVDVVEETALRNPYRRRAILRDKEVVYAA